MGALRRPQLQPELHAEPLAQSVPEPGRSERYPRWAVVSGIVVYCSICWILVWAAGSWAWGALHAGAVSR
ncbi:MAG TPA: hypothetical protein VHC73_13430 [Vitreimonas sp.]|nr:hypothetical protein [Vitreimonas sp.]